MKIIKYAPTDWAIISESAHRAVFDRSKPAHFDRIDYALLAVDEKTDTPLGYLTAREHDHETVYWQFGGGFPGTRDTIQAFRVYQAFIRHAKEAGYARITTLVENTNTAYLKFAMKVGFRIIGVRLVKQSVLLEHVLELQEG